jgi:hypothetical protein
MPMNGASPILAQLLELVVDLYDESESFLERSDEAQLWYNRGYANGVIDALDALGYGDAVASVVTPDGSDPIGEHALLPWGKAYRHGWKKGHDETYEVLKP